jgi:hypothetical protein
MTRLSSWCSLFVSLVTTGCVATHPPPAVPERIAPASGIAPDEPPLPNQGRVLLDVVNGPAKVSDVTAITTRSTPPYGNKHAFLMPALEERTLRPLCITPCAVDLAQGWHSLVFESVKDASATSTADVTVSAQPTAVRHALGREKPANGGYVGGVMMLIPAAGLTLMGSIATVVGAIAKEPATDSTGRTKGDARVFLPIGLVLLGVGAALGISGSILMVNNRPEKQSGSTAQWVIQ